MVKTVREAWIEAQKLIAKTLVLEPSEARLEAQLLLQTALNVNRAWLLSHENATLQASIHAAFEALLKRRLNGEPIAYILGKREFYGLEFIVTPDTLIPRPDTETLVEAALAKIPLGLSFPLMARQAHHERGQLNYHKQNMLTSAHPEPVEGIVEYQHKILDLGTGSGVIAIAIASQRPQAQVTATDASPAALDVAQNNAKQLLAPRPPRERGWGEGKNKREGRDRQEGQIANLRLIQSDWFTALAGQTFDIIVSNPPYIAENDPHLAQGDLRFEPVNALAAGEDGLDCIRQIISHARQHLNPQGWLMLEHGYDQAEKVAALMENAGFASISSVLDLSDILRVTVCQFIP